MKQVLDNRLRGTAGQYLKKEIKNGSKLSVLSARFTIYAFEELKSELSKVDQFRLLLSNANNIASIFGKGAEYKYRNNLDQRRIAKDCALWLASKSEIRLLTEESSLSNLMILDNKDGADCAIQGSADFSAVGLGFLPSKAPMLSLPITDPDYVRELLDWFDEYWENYSQDIKADVLEAITRLTDENSPELLYYTTLFNIFRNFAEDAEQRNIMKRRTGIESSTIWNMLYSFQKDAVIGAIRKLEEYGGCIIADSVGLGKTFEALAVIKYYELRNCRVLVLAPKKLRDNWMLYRANDIRNILADDRFAYDILNHTDLSREGGKSGDINLETVNWGNYDLIVIDESHNFRNNPAVRDRKTRYQKLMQDIIKSGVKTKVLMLSATPVNNRMSDLKNQIAFITEGRDDALKVSVGIKSIEKTLGEAQKKYNQWAALPDAKRTTERFLEMVNDDYFTLLDALTIARSRKHIQKYYDMSDIGSFPDRLKPISVKADIDTAGEFPPIQKVNDEISRLKLAVYSPLQYLRMDKIDEYSRKYDVMVHGGKGRFSATEREISLIALMRINVLKRMESSIHSFGITVSKILASTERMIELIKKKASIDCSGISIADIEIDDPELEDMLVGNTNIKVLISDLDAVRILEDLYEDRERLRKILKETKKITVMRDEKLRKLKELIVTKVNQPINPGNKKVLIFTAFADTAAYLYENIADWAREKLGLYSAMVTGSTNSKTNLPKIRHTFDSILPNFSPKSKKREKIFPHIQEEIDILIATDCISEGQNLQDCDYLVNYDIHWNPVRIIQRFGRIDRLGSENQQIQLVNFWPNVELEEYINLEARVKSRMVLLNVSATGEEDIIHQDGKNFMNDLEYRRKQLMQLQDEVLDLEDVRGGISITDLTLEDFRMDLIRFMEHNPGLLETTPTGIHSIVPIKPPVQDEVEEGVIFCLKQVRGEESGNTTSLHPYYLLYVAKSGEIKYGQSSSKKILDILKGFCLGEKEPYHELYRLFDKETKNGTNMTSYKKLLAACVQSIAGVKEEKGVASLFSLGGTSVMSDLSHGIDDYELITWLVIKEDGHA